MEHLENNTNSTTNQISKPKYEFDKVKLFFRRPYKVKYDGGEIEIFQPSIGDMIEFGEDNEYGEKDFYQTLYTFILNPTSLRLQLWEMGIDWNKISDFELFCMRIKGINPEASRLLFKEIDFAAFKVYNLKDGSPILYNQKQQIVICEDTYNHIAHYLRTMFNIFPKVEKAKGKTAKEWLIEEERDKLKVAQKNNDDKSFLLPLVSTYVNYPGTKYKSNELRDIGIYEFMNSIQRISIIESTIALMHGMYSGMISKNDIDEEMLNFMRDK